MTGIYARARPLVLVIDDDPSEEAFTELLRDHDVAAVYAHPERVTADLLDEATLVVLDQYLDTWPERRARDLPPSLTVLDGLSLSAVLRAHTDRSNQRAGRPARAVAFVLRTGELDQLAARLPVAEREHLLASQYNLEWIFPKAGSRGAGVPGVARRSALLARAVAALPQDWGPGTGDPGRAWLGLEDTDWTTAAAWQVEQCRPPWHVVADRTTGTAWLRWFLHRIVPYPTFLLDRTHAAASLGLTADSFASVVDSGDDTDLTRALDAVLYRGELAGFAGDRWWRAGLSDLTVRLALKRRRTDPDSAGEHPQGIEMSAGDEYEEDGYPNEGMSALTPAAIADALAAAHGGPLTAVSVDQPVLVLDANHETLLAAVDAQDAVRLQPDGWPPFADDAWAVRSDLDADPGNGLRDLVVSDDRWRLPATAQEERPR